MKTSTHLAPLLALGLFFVVKTTGAAITYPVSFDDPGGAYSSYYAGITSNIQAAGANWNRYLAGSGSIEIEVQVTTTVPRITGSSVTSGFVRNNGTRDIFE